MKLKVVQQIVQETTINNLRNLHQYDHKKD